LLQVCKNHLYLNIHSAKSGLPYTIICRPLSYKELQTLITLTDTKNIEHETVLRVCQMAIIKIESPFGDTLHLHELPYKDLPIISKFILNNSAVTPKDSEILYNSVTTYFSYELKSKTWDCELCKSKKLDRQRNCGFRNEQHKRDDFAIQIGEHLYTSCPIYYVDKKILSKAIECFNVYESGFLPDAGGFFDQTSFFVQASQLVQRAIRAKEKKEMENIS